MEVVEVFLVEDIESSDIFKEFEFRVGESGGDFINLSGDFLEGVEEAGGMGTNGIEDREFIEEGGIRVEGIDVIDERIEEYADVAGIFVTDIGENGVREVSDISLSGGGE